MPIAACVIALLCVLGSALLMFPSVAAWFSQYEQSQRIDQYTDDVKDLGADTLHERVREAQAYNRSLVGGGADIAANERLPIADRPDQGGGYDDLLRADADGLMARLKIPAIEVDLPISHGTSTAVLEHGVGHLEGTALPVGGASTHSVLTAHRGLATAELFTHLDRVQVGDTFTIEVFGEVLVYAVTDTRVVDPADTESLQPVTGEDLVTLVTCTPLGVNSHRILVTGERVIPTPAKELAEAGERPEIPSFPWWIVWIAGVLAVVTVYIWLSGRPPRAIRRATVSVPAASQADGGAPAPDDAGRTRPDSASDGPRTDPAQPPG